MVPTCWFLILVWAWCLPLMPEADQQREACLPQRCGNVTISAPFGLVSGAQENGCAQLGFQMHCTGNVPYLGFYELGHDLKILDIFYANASLLVSDIHKLGDFNLSGRCHVPEANTASKIAHPFSISPLNRNLVFYNCSRRPAAALKARAGLVETACRNNTFVRAGGRYDEPGDYAIEGCSEMTVTVRGPATVEMNASDYLELISDGFLVTWQPPPAAAVGRSSGYQHGGLLDPFVVLSSTCGAAWPYGRWMHPTYDGSAGYLLPGWVAAH